VAVEWALLLLCITGVLVAEMGNTLIEALVDLASPGYHPLARRAKDVAAGAVLVTAIGSAAVGLAILGPHLWHLVHR
jgi:diacylglycerol kinase